MWNNFNNTINFYKDALDGTWKRHEAISSNLANANTPRYKRKYVTFEDQLRNKLEDEKSLSLSITNKGHIDKNNNKVIPQMHKDRAGSYRLDGNNVNIDTESADLAKNTIMYDAISRQLTSEFEKVKNVITEASK